MNFTMELRSRRSKSRTPVPQIIEAQYHDLENHVSVTKTSTISSKINYSETYPSEIIDHGTNIIDHSAESLQSFEKSQHTSSFQNDEVTSSNMIAQNISNQSFEDSQHSYSSTGSNVSALDFYRAAGQYWNKYPKTDYTYSIHSKDRRELAPGVIAMPNMSRRSLNRYNSDTTEYYKSSNKNIQSQSFLQDEVDYSTKTNSWLTSATKLQPRMSSFNKHQESSHKVSISSEKSLFRRAATVFKNAIVTVLTFFYFIFAIENSILMWIGKNIHKTATRVMLWDTWLLRSAVTRQGKLNSILALCLIPLLFFGGWWLFNGLGPVLFGTDFGTTETLSNKPVKHISYDLPTRENKEQSATITDKVTTILTSEQLQEIAKLLANPVIQDILSNNEHIKLIDTSNRDISQSMVNVTNHLKEEILKVQLRLHDLEKGRTNEFDTFVTQLRIENAERIAQLTYQLNRCCRSSYLQIEQHVIRILNNLLGSPNYLPTPQDISNWLHSSFVAKHDLEIHLSNLTQHLQSHYNTLIENSGKVLMETIMDRVVSELNYQMAKRQKHEIVGELSIDSLTDEYIKKIVQDTLAVYDADKTGLVDYALESAGGQILSTRCTENYHARTAVFSLFGIPLWYLGNTPRTVIMPGVTPGECWAFQNFPGFLVIKLTAPVKIEAFSLEHVSKLLAPNGRIDSAPKEFFVLGLRNETDKEPVLLGQYKYDLNGPPLQYFVTQIHGLVFNIIELRIHSNHGNPNYTCLYRFRVHGILSNEPT